MRDGRPAHWRGIYDDEGRVMVAICHNMDLGDAVEHSDTVGYPEPYSARAMRTFINYIIDFLRVHAGGDDRLGDVGPLPLPRPRSTIPFYLFAVQVLAVLGRWRLRLSRVALTVQLRQRFRFRLDSVRRFVTGVADTVAVPVGKVRGGNVRAVVRLVGNSVAVRVLIDRAGVAIPVAVCIGLIRILDIGAVVERVWDVVAVRIELEEGRFVGRSGIVACRQWLLDAGAASSLETTSL